MRRWLKPALRFSAASFSLAHLAWVGSASERLPIIDPPIRRNLAVSQVSLSTGRQVSATNQAPTAVQRAQSLNLPEAFARHAAGRVVLDEYPFSHRQVEGDLRPSPIRPLRVRKNSDQFIRVVRANVSAAALAYRSSQEMTASPLRGFRAPILDEINEPHNLNLDAAKLTPTQREAAEIVSQHLARDGILQTLARVIEVLGPAKFNTGDPTLLNELWNVGLPVDWLENFQIGQNDSRTPMALVPLIARSQTSGESSNSLRSKLGSATFRFVKSRGDYRVATESGEQEMGLVRLQVGGGYDNGIVPGDSLHLTSQLVATLPDVDFVAGVPEEYLNNLSWLALNCWPLKRTNQFTFVPEKSHLTPWAQDNGKAGIAGVDPNKSLRAAILAPRFASQSEDDSIFVPGDSYLMDGFRAAGIEVVHSPLHFQGGNLLPVNDAVSGKRILLVGEAEIYRNTALGLSRDQVLEAFRIEFGVDACVIIPAASHHLDYDISVRSQPGKVMAFVNDATAAARLIALRGIDALELCRGLSPAEAKDVREQLSARKDTQVCRTLFRAIERFRNAQSRFPISIVEKFATAKTDSPQGNFQCFLVALDVLASLSKNADAPKDKATQQYYDALREVQSATQRQVDVLEKLGWKIVRIPSMPDLYRSINYLNGIHDRTRFVMPMVGGFYDSVDRAALGAFKEALGPDIKISGILCGASERNHGAVHCVVSVFPRLGQ